MQILKKEMGLKGYTSKSLGKEIGVSGPAVQTWIRGESKPLPVSIKKLKKLGFSDKACFEPSFDVDLSIISDQK